MCLFYLQLRSVCSYLRSCGVQGHLGVFGVHYEADNSRLYVVCAKHVAESQLHNEFTVFGDARVKLNCDANGFSKVIFLSNFFLFRVEHVHSVKRIIRCESLITPSVCSCYELSLSVVRGSCHGLHRFCSMLGLCLHSVHRE